MNSTGKSGRITIVTPERVATALLLFGDDKVKMARNETMKRNNLLQLNKNKIHNETKREQNKKNMKNKNQLPSP